MGDAVDAPATAAPCTPTTFELEVDAAPKQDESAASMQDESASSMQDESAAPKQDESAAPFRMQIIALLCIFCYVYFVDRTHLWLAAPSVMDDLDIDKSKFGLAMSAYSASYALALVPTSALMKRVGAKYGFAMMLFLMGVVVMATAAVTDLGSLVAMRTVLGIVQAPFIPAISQYNAMTFKGNVARATALTLSVGFPLSQILPLGALILYASSSTSFDWGWLQVIEGALAVVLTPLAFLLPAPEDEPGQKKTGEKPDERQTAASGYRALLGDARLYAALGVFVGHFSALIGTTMWLPTVIKESSELTTAAAAAVTSIPPSIAIPVGIVWSGVCDRSSGTPLKFAAAGQTVVLLGVLCSGTVMSVMGEGAARTALLVVCQSLISSGQPMFYGAFISWQAKAIFSRFTPNVASVGYAIVNIGTASGYIVGQSVAGAVSSEVSFAAAFFTLAGFSGGALLTSIVLIVFDARQRQRRLLQAIGADADVAAHEGQPT